LQHKDKYHETPQPFRIQKRLALNQCFRSVQSLLRKDSELTYVTFGGDNLYDLVDLVMVLDLKSLRLNVFSYEHDAKVAARAGCCPVLTTLKKIPTVKIRIIESSFPDDVTLLKNLKRTHRFIYFLDFFGTFTERQAQYVGELVRAGLIVPEDFLLITSCLSPRIVHQEGFMKHFEPHFRTYYPGKEINRDFRVRNHVDLLLDLEFARLFQASRVLRPKNVLGPQPLRKLRYRDSQAHMGVWLFEIIKATGPQISLSDIRFEDFPESFVPIRHAPGSIPNIFE
jgi:hypothetical protein